MEMRTDAGIAANAYFATVADVGVVLNVYVLPHFDKQPLAKKNSQSSA